jgi:hypothetical protein
MENGGFLGFCQALGIATGGRKPRGKDQAWMRGSSPRMTFLF